MRISDLRLLRRDAVDLNRGVVEVLTGKTDEPAATYVFVTDAGQPYSIPTLQRHFSIAKKIAGITRRCQFNDLRHTFGSNLVSEGADITIVQKAFGHTMARQSDTRSRMRTRSASCATRSIGRQSARSRQ